MLDRNRLHFDNHAHLESQIRKRILKMWPSTADAHHILYQ